MAASLDPTLDAPEALLPVPAGALTVGPPVEAAPGVRLSLIIPTYNEGRNVAELLRALTALLDAPLGDAYELIVVDDDSPDRTWEIALGLQARYPRLRVMRRRNERCLSTAVIRGWQAARGEVLGVIDADLQHPPEITVKLWEEIARGADLAVGSRHVEGGGVSDWSMLRRVLSRGAQLLGLMILPAVVGRVSDPMSGYFMVRRSAIAGRPMHPRGYKILIEVLGRGKIRWIGEVGYVFRERVEGESKVTRRLYVDYLLHLLRLRIDTLPTARFLRFALVALGGVAVDTGLLYLLSDPRSLGWGLVESKVIAAEAAIVNNFLWNDAWTFADLARSQRGARPRLHRFLKFDLICSTGVGLNLGLLYLLYTRVGLDRYSSNAIAILLVTVWNFWLSLRLSWRSADLGEGGR